MTEDFFLVLPSNVSKDGKANDFTTILPEELVLDGNWQCSLFEMNYTTTANTFNNENFDIISSITEREYKVPSTVDDEYAPVDSQYKLVKVKKTEYLYFWKLCPKDGGVVKDVSINDKLKNSMTSLIVREIIEDNSKTFQGSVIHTTKEHSFQEGSSWTEYTVKENIVKSLKLGSIALKSVDEVVRYLNDKFGKYAKISLSADNKLNFKSDYIILFHENLKYLLGFLNDRLEIGINEAAFKPHVLYNMDSMFVYCDIVKHLTVGSSKTQLLRIVPFRGGEKNAHESYNLMYVDVQSSYIKQISIQIRTDTGQLFPFPSNAKCNVVLHFKRKTS
jgi:hypothetical protein